MFGKQKHYTVLNFTNTFALMYSMGVWSPQADEVWFFCAFFPVCLVNETAVLAVCNDLLSDVYASADFFFFVTNAREIPTAVFWFTAQLITCGWCLALDNRNLKIKGNICLSIEAAGLKRSNQFDRTMSGYCGISMPTPMVPTPRGLEAIYSTLKQVYPDQPNPLQVTAVVKYWWVFTERKLDSCIRTVFFTVIWSRTIRLIVSDYWTYVVLFYLLLPIEEAYLFLFISGCQETQ